METKEYKTYSNSGKTLDKKTNKMVVDKRRVKRSLMARNVAEEVVEKIKSGKHINLVDIQVRNGYSMKSALSQKAIRTKTYEDVVTPVLEKMSAIRDKALTSLLKRDVTNEKYSVLIDGVDKLTKNTQLLSGKSTENVANNIVMYGETDLMSKQVKE